MKNNIKYLLVFVWSTMLFSCVDLDEIPKGELSPESYYTSGDALRAAVTGIYGSAYGWYSGYDSPTGAFFGSILSEDMATGVTNYNILNFNSENGDIKNVWAMHYRWIGNANLVIGNLDNSNIAQKDLDYAEGQARFMRALGYFYLTRYYGEIPIITNENSSIANEVGQSTFNEIYDFIVNDLKIAEEKLEISYANEKALATKGSAKALLAKVYLTMAGWPIEDDSYYALARDKAKEVMDMGEYSLEPDFKDLWLEKNKLTNSEFIFAFYGSSDNIGSASHLHTASRPSSEKGWANFYSEEHFFNAFPEGHRKEVSFHTDFNDGANWKDVNPKQPFIAKYRDAGELAATFDSDVISFDGDGFLPILRYADVLLIYAEAANMAENGPSAAALEAINKVRRRAMKIDPDTPDASVDLTSMSKADFDDAVIAERNWELAFENNRWFDVVRKNKVVEVYQPLYPQYVTENTRLVPKPATEVEAIEGLEQNPGY
jgi:hypothetical protein